MYRVYLTTKVDPTKLKQGSGIIVLESDDYKDPLNPAMFNNTFDCFDYCMDLCKDIEDYFWDSLYPDIQQTYFEEHAELP